MGLQETGSRPHIKGSRELTLPTDDRRFKAVDRPSPDAPNKLTRKALPSTATKIFTTIDTHPRRIAVAFMTVFDL
jgi:hypothetical protein